MTNIECLAEATLNSLPPSKRRELELQEAILMFQISRDEDDFSLITDRYDPMRYRAKWFSSYGHLFDSGDDFDGQMNECFAKACDRYKTGYPINPFYWGILRTTFANIIKHRSAQMRNPSVRCPICDDMVAPLSRHLLDSHPELIEAGLRDMGVDFDEMEFCPLCKQGVKRGVPFRTPEEKNGHFTANHGTFIFNYFMSKHPNHHTAIKDPAPPLSSVISEDVEDDGQWVGIDDLDVDPIIESAHQEVDHGARSLIWCMLCEEQLTHCQRSLLETVLFEGLDDLPSASRLCDICLETQGTCPRVEEEEGFRLTRMKLDEELDALSTIFDHD